MSKLACAGCTATYVGKTQRHIKTRIIEHLYIDKKSNIFRNLEGNDSCKFKCDENYFKVSDTASSAFRLNVKEELHIKCGNQY